MLMCYTKVHDETDRPHNVSEKSHQLNVYTPLTLPMGHLVCLHHLGGCVEEVREFLHRPIVRLLPDTRVNSTCGNVVNEGVTVKYELLASSCRLRHSCDDRDLCTYS